MAAGFRLTASLAAMRRLGTGALLVASGCHPYRAPMTEVRVRDPSRVSLRSLDDRPVVAEGRQPARGTVAAGRLDLGRGASTAYRVDALREQSGGIAFEVAAPAPVSGGERREILAPDGNILPLGQEGSTVVGPRVSEDLTFPVCGSLAPIRYGYGVTLGSDCSRGPAPFGGRLSTPWANVVEAREIQHVNRAELVSAAVLGSVWTVGGGLAVGLAQTLDGQGRSTVTGLGTIALVGGVAAVVYAIVLGNTPDRIKVLDRPVGPAAGTR